ncbi:MAG: MerR family transcriptional regulator [Bdellovibrionales bacterium]
MSVNSRKAHTVKQVAKLSGVSVRTLRFYDEIGLLKPASVGDNGYRYYEKEQLLALQQILFYRELGFELARIRKILASSEFDKAAALKSHREFLVRESERTAILIRTIDKTLAHLEREASMQDDELYLGFDSESQAEYEREIVERWGEPARQHLEECRLRTRTWKKEDYEGVKKEFDELHRAFTEALKNGVAPGALEVQSLVRRHVARVDHFWTPNRESYIGLGRMYCEHSGFRKVYDAYHPKLAEFLAQAMKIYAERELSGAVGAVDEKF